MTATRTNQHAEPKKVSHPDGPTASTKTSQNTAPKPTKTPVGPPAARKKLLKDKKPKLVRDSFTMPKLEYLILDQLKQRGSLLGLSVKKSELLRAGVKVLAKMPDAAFADALKSIPASATERPSKV